jgi:HD superfamily phosphodiesterase
MHLSERETHMLAEVFTEVQARFADFTDLAHGWEHVYRVFHLALQVAEQEHANGFLVGLAALLHDLGRTIRDPTRPHAERSALLAVELLADARVHTGTAGRRHRTKDAASRALNLDGYRSSALCLRRIRGSHGAPLRTSLRRALQENSRSPAYSLLPGAGPAGISDSLRR